MFLEAMAETADDPTARARAYQLLSREARGALSERAREATAVSGRTFAGYEMIVEARYRLRFRPRDVGGFREQIDGDRAIVTVLGVRGGDRAHVPMVREGRSWKVHLDVPRPTHARPPATMVAPAPARVR